MIRFKVDENLPAEAATILTDAGHDAVTVLDQRLQGTPDQNLSEICQAEGRAIVTLDLDFSDIRTYPPADYPGIVVLRLTKQDKATVLEALKSLLPAFAAEPVAGTLWVVGEDKIRIR